MRTGSRALCLGLAGGAAFVAAGLPLAAVVARLEPAAVGALVGHPAIWRLLGRSLMLAALVTGGTLAVGIPLGLLYARTDLPGRAVLGWAGAFPIFLPPFLLALGWFHLLGRRGLVGNEQTAGWLFSDLGLVAVMTAALAPIVTTLVGMAAGGLDPALEEAGRTVARPARVLWSIVLPAVRPAVVLAAIMVFALTFGELGAPTLLRREVYPAAVFARLGGVDLALGEAMALCLPLLPVGLALLALERRWCSGRGFDLLGLRSRERAVLPLGRWRWPLGALALGVTAVSLAPLGALLWRAGALGGVGELRRFLGASLGNSLVLGAAGATLALVLAVILGHDLVRGGRVSRLCDGLLLLSFLLPPAVLGLGLIAVWNRPAGQLIYGSLAVLVVAVVGRYGVVALRACAVCLAQSPARLEEAAQVCGAGYLRRLLWIVLPPQRSGLIVAWLLSFVFAVRDLEIPVLLYPPGGEPLIVRLFTLEANGPEPVVAALGWVQVGLTAVVVAIAFGLARRG